MAVHLDLLEHPVATRAAPTAFVVLEGDDVVARSATIDAAIGRATGRLRALIEANRYGTIKVLDPRGHVLWRESATL